MKLSFPRITRRWPRPVILVSVLVLIAAVLSVTASKAIPAFNNQTTVAKAAPKGPTQQGYPQHSQAGAPPPSTAPPLSENSPGGLVGGGSSAPGLVDQQPSVTNQDWPMFRHGPSHTGQTTQQGLDIGNVKSLQQRWAQKLGGAIVSSAAVVGNTVYVGSKDKALHALDLHTGAVLWTFRTGGHDVSAPAVDGGHVYVTSADGILYAINASTGLQKWVTPPLGLTTSSPTVYNGMVYVGAAHGSQDQRMYAFNQVSGQVAWFYPQAGQVGGISSSPAINTVHNTLYFGSHDGFLYALDATHGTFLWRVETGDRITSSPAVSEQLQLVYFGSHDGKVRAVDADPNVSDGGGITKWTAPVSATTSPAIAEAPSSSGLHSVLYVSSNDGYLYAYDANGGTYLWSQVIGQADTSTPSPSVVGTNVVFIGSDKKLVARRASDGLPLWSRPTGGTVTASPAVASDMVFVGSQDGFMYAYYVPPQLASSTVPSTPSASAGTPPPTPQNGVPTAPPTPQAAAPGSQPAPRSNALALPSPSATRRPAPAANADATRTVAGTFSLDATCPRRPVVPRGCLPTTICSG